jgi:hypothetical protein
MSKFQRRHYVAIAEVLAYSKASDKVINEISDMFSRDNPNFSHARFTGHIIGFGGPQR